MKTPRLAFAMGYIDDDLLLGAKERNRPSAKKARFFYAAAAACICLAVLGGIRMKMEADSRSNLNESSAHAYGVLAEVIEVLEDGKYKVEITGRDTNFDIGDIVIVEYDYPGKKEFSLKAGDAIAITYFEFQKTQEGYEITAGQIDKFETAADRL